MPVSKCNGKWRIGDGECTFSSKAKAEAAFKHWVETQNGKFILDPQLGLIVWFEKNPIVPSDKPATFAPSEIAKHYVELETKFEVYDQESE